MDEIKIIINLQTKQQIIFFQSVERTANLVKTLTTVTYVKMTSSFSKEFSPSAYKDVLLDI